MIALNATLVCDTEGCEKTIDVHSRLAMTGLHSYRIRPMYIPDGWRYSESTLFEEVRCPDCAAKGVQP